MVGEDSILSFARPKWRLSKTAAEKLQRCARAIGRRAPLMLPGVVMSCMRIAGCCLCCARARHAELARSRRKQRRDVTSVLGERAGRRRRVGAVCERRRAVPQAALSRGLMTVVWDVGAGTSVIKKVGWYVP